MSDFRQPGNTAVITGGARGIGLCAARMYLEADMTVLIADIDEAALEEALRELGGVSEGRLYAQQCDVSDLVSVKQLRDAAMSKLGKVNCLMNNAGVIRRAGQPWDDLSTLHETLGINFMGVVHGCHAFIPAMLEEGSTGVIINTGSKQGITRPPGSYVYNLSKTCVLAYTESVAHALRQLDDCKLTAHLLVPGSVYTPMVQQFIPEKPDFAWTAEETLEFALPRIESGDFYVICPDNESPRELDEKRMQWSADDLIKNRPALSRWHPDFKDEFAAYVRE